MMLKIFNKNKWLAIVLSIAFLLAISTDISQASSYTVPQKESIHIDFAYQHTNLNSRPYLMIANYTDPATSERTLAGSYIKFDTIPHRPQQELVRAEWHFRVLSHLGNNEGQLRIRPAAHLWNEEEATWAHQPASLSDGIHTVSPDIDLSSGWKTVDITPLVQGWLDGSLDPEKGMSVFSRDNGWLLTIDRRNNPSYLTVEYRDNIGEGGGDEMGVPEDSSSLSDSSDSTDDSAVDEDVVERTEILHLIFPGDNEKITDQTPTFVWSERNRSYDLSKLVLVLEKENGDSVFDTEVDLDSTSYNNPRKLSPDKYKWYIKGYWNGEEVFKTDENKFEVISNNEEGLTEEEGAIEENTNTGDSVTENNGVITEVDESINDNFEPISQSDVSNTNYSETNNEKETNSKLDIYKLLVVVLLVIVIGLLVWLLKGKKVNEKKDDASKKSVIDKTKIDNSDRS